MALTDMPFRINQARSRFELEAEGGLVIAEYFKRDGMIDIRHMETPVPLQGRGLATRLMDAIVTFARAEGYRIRPTCPFAAAYFAERPELRDVRM